MSKELLNLLIQVVQSWQVIFITIAIVLYISLVSYVSRSHHRPRAVSTSKPKPKKKKANSVSVADETNDESDSNEGLELEKA